MKKNLKELSTKGFISNVMILYLLSTISLIGIVTDKIIKTDKALMNIKDYVSYFRLESAAILNLKQYLIDLKEYDQKVADLENKRALEENETGEDEEIEEIEEIIEPDVIYVYDEPIYYFFLDNIVEIYYLDVKLVVQINNYQIYSYTIG